MFSTFYKLLVREDVRMVKLYLWIFFKKALALVRGGHY